MIPPTRARPPAEPVLPANPAASAAAVRTEMPSRTVSVTQRA